MTDSPFFTIIIPTFNRSHTIRRTLDSCLNQTYSNYEILIIDDGSIDETEKIIQNYTDQKIIYYKKENGERAVARNLGISKAKGRYITFLDSDDIIYPELLNHVHAELSKLLFPVFFNQAYEIKNDSNNVIQTIKYKDDDLDILISGNSMSCIGNFIKREITTDYSFNEDRRIIRSEDWELWIRIAAKYGYKSDNKVLCCVMDHAERSVRNFNTKNLIEHKYIAIESAFKDPLVLEKFSAYKKRIYSYCDTYISLHLTIKGHKKEGISFLISGIHKYPPFIFKKRFFAILKYLILK